MFKKLLVAVLALTIIVGLFSPALATKDPTEAKRLLHQTLPPGPLKDRVIGVSEIPQGTPGRTPARHQAPPGMVMHRPGAPCSDNTYMGALAYYWDNVPGAAMRFTAAGTCTLKTLAISFYTGGVIPAAAGITAYVWGDNGLGLPGSVVFSQNIPNGSIVYYPTNVTVALPNLVFSGTNYITGYIENNFTDSYRPLTDAGGTGDHSLYYDNTTPAWFTMLNATNPPTDYNWSIIVNSCCVTGGGGSDCQLLAYDAGVYYRWSDKLPKAVRFSVAKECTLKAVMFNISSGGQVGTGGVDIKVFADNSGLPGALLATKHLAHGQITIPGVTHVDFSANNLVFTSDFHVAYYITNPGTDDYEMRSDDGTVGTGRSSIDTTGAGNWCLNSIALAPDDPNWLIQDSVCCSTAEPVCRTESYHGAPGYFWPLPDAYGDNFFNMRFSNATKCTLKTLKLGFYAAGSVGTPGATVYLWKSDGEFPTTVINSFPVNPVVDYYPAFTQVDVSPLNIVRSGEFHVGYSVIGAGKLAILSDDGSTATGRGSEFYSGAFSSMANDWGIDAAFFIEVVKCCQPVGYCDVVTDPNDQWPTFAHDFARTSESGIKLGDLCGIRNAWVFNPGVAQQINFTAPVIMNDRVYVAYADRYVCVNLLTGALVWSTKAAPLNTQYTAIVGSMRTMPTIEGDYIYMPTGSTRGMIKANRLTGDTIWTRSTITGGTLPGVPGATTYSPSVIMGNAVYFGDVNGQVYALNKTTGANLYFAQLFTDPPANTLKGGINGGLSSDGTQLFVGTYNGLPTTGAVWSITPGVSSFTTNWVYKDPNNPAVAEGWFSAPTFRCDNLFINTFAGAAINTNYKGIRQNLDPTTGAQKWPDYYLMGQAWSAPVATIGGYKPLAIFANLNNGSQGAPSSRSVRAVNFANSTVWINAGTPSTYDNDCFVHASTTQDPYVVYGTGDQLNITGQWRIADGNTGEILIDYGFSGFVMGTAIAKGSDGKTYLVAALRSTGFSSSGIGKLFAFKDMGPRPRMIVPETVVDLPATSGAEVAPVQRTDNDAILNIGCATLNFTGTLEAGFPLKARISSVSPWAKKDAQALSSRFIDHTVDELMHVTASMPTSKMFSNSFTQGEEGEFVSTVAGVKPAQANSQKLAPPSWVSWITPAGGVGAVAAGGSQNFTFQFDRTTMQLLAVNYFFVDISSNDPDFNVEDQLNPLQAEIQYNIPYVYCVTDTGRMKFGVTGGEWFANDGRFGDGAVTFDFTLDGSTDGAFLYAGTMFFMTSMNSAAWCPQGSTVPVGLNFLKPFYVNALDCGGCQFNTTLPVEYTTNGGVSYTALVGDLCSFAMIDSGQAFPGYAHQTGPSMGILVKYREVGAYGPDFGDFKLVVVDIFNRYATPITGLYFGNYEDWDIGSGSNNGNGDIAKGLVYLNEGPMVRGQIGLPLKGSYWAGGVKTDPMYNAMIVSNPVWVYPTATGCPPNGECLLDSLYGAVAARPQGVLSYTDGANANGTPDDLSYIVAFGKADLAGGGSHTYGFAMYGNDNLASPIADMDARAKFINKYAGFGRGDIDNNGVIDLKDVVRLQRYLHSGGPGPVPFKHLGDVNNDGLVNDADCAYMAAYFFGAGPAPVGAFKF